MQVSLSSPSPRPQLVPEPRHSLTATFSSSSSALNSQLCLEAASAGEKTVPQRQFGCSPGDSVSWSCCRSEIGEDRGPCTLQMVKSKWDPEGEAKRKNTPTVVVSDRNAPDLDYQDSISYQPALKLILYSTNPLQPSLVLQQTRYFRQVTPKTTHNATMLHT